MGIRPSYAPKENERCSQCGGVVYLTERLATETAVFHKVRGGGGMRVGMAVKAGVRGLTPIC